MTYGQPGGGSKPDDADVHADSWTLSQALRLNW
jgi:hypothetical protein